MAIAESYSGTATIGTTEYDLPSNTTTKSAITTNAIVQVFLDLSALTATEEYRFRIYEEVVDGATQKVIEDVIISGAQTAQPIYVTPSLILMHGWTFTLTKNQGTDRSITWSIRQVA
jgi:hypothetical protein